MSRKYLEHGVTSKKLFRAKARAYKILQDWNEVTGFIPKGSSYWWEIESIVEDAIHCGIQAALDIREPLESEVTDDS